MLFLVGSAYNFAMRYMRGSVRALELGGNFRTITCQENSWHVAHYPDVTLFLPLFFDSYNSISTLS